MEEIGTLVEDLSVREDELRQDVEESERVLQGLERDLNAANDRLADLLHQGEKYTLLGDVCRSLDKLEELDAAHLFWGEHEDRTTQIEAVRERIDAHQREINGAETQRESLIEQIGDQNRSLDCLHYELVDIMEREEARRGEWVVERDADTLPAHKQVMPWARRTEEDKRFRQSLLSSLAASLVVAILLGSIAIPIVEREEIIEVPERVARLVQQRVKPPEPEPQPIFEEEIPEPEPEKVEELVETLPDEPVPEAVQTPTVAEEPNVREQVKAKGILAFSSSISDRANMNTRAQLGSSARFSNAGDEAVGRTQRSMVTSNAPGSSGGINLADISRDYGGGGGGSLGGVEVSQVASSIGTGGSGNADRPLAGGAVAGRTDEEIQIVFDRHKAALYRLYNRELRKNPTLRGQLVLKLTIEPDGSVSFCILQSSTMDAPVLGQQVVERVIAFDFGAKEDIAAVTIIYPIDFLPAG